MAGIISNVDSDVQKLRKLKNEIEEVKKALKGINIKVDIDIAKGMEAQLKSLTEQYNALVAKVAEAEGKIMLSTKRINDASERIIQAQEKLSKVTGISSQPTATQSTPSNAAETASVKAQAKAYDELKDEIDGIIGTRSQNIKRMIEESNAIRLINAEIKKITKSQGEYSSLSSTQKVCLEQLNNSLLTHKTALAEVRQNLNNNVKMDNAAATSMNGLSQSLSRMRIAYRELTEEERNSPFGKQLLASINQADSKIKELDATIGNHQRNVGNYGNSFNDLLGKVQSVPGPIGNVTTSIQSLTKASLTFIATPIGAVLAAISAALAVLSSWFNRTEEGQNALNVASAYFKQTLDSILDVVDDAGEWIWKAFTKPKEALTDLVDFLEGQVMNRLKAFGKMGEAIWKIFSGDFSEGFNDFGNAYMQGVTGIADAGKKASAFMDETNKKAQKRMEIAQKQNELDVKERKNIVERSKLEAKINELREKAYDERIPEKERAKAIKEASALTKKMYDDEIALAQERYEIVRDTNALSHSNKDAKMKEAQAEAAVNRLRASQAAAQRALLRQSNRFNNSNKLDTLRKNQEKYNLLLDKQALEQKRSAEDLQNQVDESRIKAMNEGSKKTIAQMELNFEKELQVIDRQKEDALRKKVEDARSAFESNPKNKGKSFDATGIKLSDDENKYFEELYKSAIVNNEKAYSELANQYLSYTDQRLAIEKKFNDDIALLQEARKKAEEKGDTDEVAKIDRSIGKRTETKNEDVFKLDAEQFKKSMNWEQVFGNLDKVSTDTLKKLKSNLKDFISAQKDLSPENLKELVDAIERIDDKVSERNPFEAMETSFKSLKFATDAEREAQEAYNKALKEGTDEEKKNAKATLESAKNSKQKALSEATTSLHKGVDEIGQYVEAGNEVIDIMKTLGVKTPEWLEGTMSGFGEILNGLSNIDLTKPMSIVTGGLQTIKGALTSVISLGGLIPGFGGADYSSYNEMVSKYDDLLDTWDALLEKKRAYINESYGAEAIKAGDEALDLLNTEKEITKQLADSRLNSGSSAGSHSLWYRMWKGSYKFEGQNWRDVAGDVMRGLQKEGLGNVSFNGMGDMLNMTSEQLLWIKKNYTGLWTTMDGDFRGYLEQLIEYGETEQSIIESIQDQLTQTSFDNVYSNFFDTLMDMKAEASDFSDDLNEMFMRSLLSNEIGTKYKNKLGEWYEKWSETMKLKDDAKRKLELEKLREEYEGYVNSAIQERNDLANSIGYTGDTESFSQSSTKKGFEAMSQDTGEELNGRFTALQAFNEEIKNQSVVQSQSLNLLTAKADTILSVNTEARNIADDTRDLIANSYLELMQISENTGNSAKYLKDIKADMAEVKKNTSKL